MKKLLKIDKYQNKIFYKWLKKLTSLAFKFSLIFKHVKLSRWTSRKHWKIMIYLNLFNKLT